VEIPRIEATVEVDGRLSEPAWQQAARRSRSCRQRRLGPVLPLHVQRRPAGEHVRRQPARRPDGWRSRGRDEWIGRRVRRRVVCIPLRVCATSRRPHRTGAFTSSAGSRARGMKTRGRGPPSRARDGSQFLRHHARRRHARRNARWGVNAEPDAQWHGQPGLLAVGVRRDVGEYAQRLALFLSAASRHGHLRRLRQHAGRRSRSATNAAPGLQRTRDGFLLKISYLLRL
jgi:hypothetical protein